jgi:hypothetical protein
MLLQCHENASLAVSDGNPYCMLILSGPSCHTEKGFFWLRRGVAGNETPLVETHGFAA